MTGMSKRQTAKAGESKKDNKRPHGQNGYDSLPNQRRIQIP